MQTTTRLQGLTPVCTELATWLRCPEHPQSHWPQLALVSWAASNPRAETPCAQLPVPRQELEEADTGSDTRSPSPPPRAQHVPRHRGSEMGRHPDPECCLTLLQSSAPSQTWLPPHAAKLLRRHLEGRDSPAPFPCLSTAGEQRRPPPASPVSLTYLPRHHCPLEKEGQTKGQKPSNPPWATHCTRCPREPGQVTHLPSALVCSGDR